MGLNLYSILLVIFLIHSTHGTVHKLTSNNLDAFYATHDIVVLLFCVPWSSQCKDTIPEYERASNTANYPVGKIAFGIIDAKAEGKLRNQYNVWSYPFITLRKQDGSLTPFTGRAHAGAIINFVKRASFTNLKAVSTPDQIEQFLHLEDVAVLGYFEEDKREYRNFYEVTKKLQSKILIGFVNNGTHLRSAYEIEPGPASVIVYKRFENSMLVYKSDFFIQVLAKWIVDNTKMQINYLYPENAFKYLGFKIPGVLLFVDTLTSPNSLTRTTFQQELSYFFPLTVTTIRNSTILSSPSSPSSPSNDDDDNNDQANQNNEPHKDHNTYTTHTVRLQMPPHHDDMPAYPNLMPHYTSTLPPNSNRACTGDYLNCMFLLREVVPYYKGRMNFIYTDGQAYKPFMTRLGVTKLPSVVLMDWSQEKHYIFDPNLPITSANLVAFFSNFTDNSLLHYIRSAPASSPSSSSTSSTLSSPDSPLSSPPPLSPTVLLEGNTNILHVIANNFNELVLNNTKPVLMNIHLPWCGFCKSMWPAYEELSKIVTDNVVIADFDASINDMPRDFPVTAWPSLFPHITLFGKNDKMNPIAMTSDPSLSNMIQFLVDNISGLEVGQPEASKPQV